ncbi:MAG: glycosyltransferase family 39 protein [Nanoarchaeota archaeon]
MKKSLLLIIIVLALLIGIGVRVVNLWTPLYEDEHFYAQITSEREQGFFTFNTLYHGMELPWVHEPLSGLIWRAAHLFISPAALAVRAVSFIFGLGTMGIVFLFSCRIFSKRTAWITLVVMALSFYHVIASMQIDIDGAILTFFIALCIYLYWKGEETGKWRWTVLSAVALALGLWSKTPALIVLPILGMYILLCGLSKKGIIRFSVMASLAGLLYLPFFYLFRSDVVNETTGYAISKFSFLPTPLPIIYLFLWATPPLFFALFLKGKKHNLISLWAVLSVVGYLFLESHSPFDKYLMICIPPLCMLLGHALSRQSMTWRSFLSGLGGGVSLLVILNINTPIIAHGIPHYFSQVMSFSWFFFFPLTGPSGPTIGASFLSLAIIWIASIGLLILYRRGWHAKQMLGIFLGIGLALNLFLIQEMTFHGFYPNVGAVTEEVISFADAEGLLPPYVTNIVSTEYYLDRGGMHTYRFTYADSLKDIRNQKRLGRTVILVDFPYFAEEKLLLFSDCTLLRRVITHGRPMGWVYRC